MKFKRGYLLAISAIASAAVLSLELLATRIMAPVVGSGPLAWSMLLAVAFGALALGNLLGGWLCGRYSIEATCAWILAGAAFFLLVLSWTYPILMRHLVNLPFLWCAFLSALFTQAAPMLLLGSLSPIILSIGDEPSRGRWAGRVLACGSVGGMAGVIATGLLLLPAVGIKRSLLAIAFMLVIIALLGVWRVKQTGLTIVVIAVLVLSVIGLLAVPANAGIESLFGRIDIHRGNGQSVLYIDGLPQTGIPHDIQIQPWQALDNGYLLEAALLLKQVNFTQPGGALVIGLGAGLAPHVLAAHGYECEAVEIDSKVVDTARAEFGFNGMVHIMDGRIFLQCDNRKLDIIVLDVCTSERLALHLFTREAMHLIQDRLAPEGILAVQFIGDDGPWCAILVRTVHDAFKHVLVLAQSQSIPLANVGPRWLFASKTELNNLESMDTLPLRAIAIDDEEGQLLSDDFFPAEMVWANVAYRWRVTHGLTP